MKKNIFSMTICLTLLLLIMSACSPAQATQSESTPVPEEPTQAEVATEVPEEEPAEEVQAAEAPKELKIVGLSVNTLDDPWAQALIQSADRVVAEKYHDLDISFTYVESVPYADAERVTREYASSGEYGIIIVHTNLTDAVSAVRDEFPDQLISITCSTYDDYKSGTNGYWIDPVNGTESSFLSGVLAGKMTETNTVGVVAGYPVESTNLNINGFIDGAKYVNPDIQAKVTFIESWFDPAKAREAAETQINTGADVIFAMMFGPFEAVTEHGIYGVGIYVDQEYLAPESILTSSMVFWDKHIEYLIDQWWEKEVNGVPYSSPEGKILFKFTEGSSDIAPINEEIVPQDVIDYVMGVRQQILDGDITVEMRPEAPESD